MNAPGQGCPADAEVSRQIDVPARMEAVFALYRQRVDEWYSAEATPGMPAFDLIRAIEADLYGSSCSESLLRRELVKLISETIGNAENANVTDLRFRFDPTAVKALQKTFEISIHNSENYQNAYSYVYTWNGKTFELAETEVFHI
ncbi:MAG TPA: hypothetical protein V6D23_10585 [Candidatus Obscuribacterales bacterium]